MHSRMEENRSARLRCTIWTCSWLILLVSPLTATRSGREGDKVELVLYYETLCPYCSNFIVNHLPKVFDNGLISHVDLKLIPYGNARIGVNDTISCQVHVASLPCHSITPHLLLSLSPAAAVLDPTEPQNPRTISSSSMRSNMPSGSHPALSLLTYLSLCSLFSPSSSSEIALPSDSSHKVSLGLYYESLCPYSANFIVNHLAKIFDSDLISRVDLNLVPWGNAKIKGNATFDCQHGPSECLLNTVEACAIDIWPELNEHFPLIYCIEKLVFSHDYAQWESCFEPLGLDSKLVSDCYAGGRGKELELEYAAETNALQPPHQYVPWVVVDGKPLYDDYENFMSYICEAYGGTAKPEACSELSLNWVQLREAHKTRPACYMNEKMSSPASKVARSAVDSMIGWTKMLLDV